MTAPQPEIRYTTHCLFCPKTFDVSDLSVPRPGKTQQERAVEYVKILGKHIEKKHPEKYAVVNAAAMDMWGLQVAKLFTHEDPAFNRLVAELKAAFHQL